MSKRARSMQHGLPIKHRTISVSDIAATETALFQGEQGALDYIAAHFPSKARFYVPLEPEPPI